jgi:rod shape-determining protein MreD
MKSLWRGAAGLLAAAGGQFLLLRYAPALGRSVDLFTVLVIFYAVTRRRVGVMMMGTAAGLTEDLLTATFLGMNAFKKTLVGYLMGTLGSFFMLSQPIPRFAVLVVATFLEAVTEAALVLVLGQHLVLPDGSQLLWLGLGNGIAGIVGYWLIAKMVD